MSITELFRSSKKASKKAYNNGYTAACHDLLTFIQQGVSVGEVAESASAVSQRVDGDGMNIGRVMDWIEGRIDAVIAREEEEEEEEEREKDKERTGPSTARATPTVVAALSKQERPKATNFPSNSPISSKEVRLLVSCSLWPSLTTGNHSSRRRDKALLLLHHPHRLPRHRYRPRQ